MLMGAIYRAALALEVQKLGYDVRITHADGFFELAHITREQTTVFSTRRREIEKALAADGKSREQASAVEKQVANLATRRGRTETDLDALRGHWLTLSRNHGVVYQPGLNPRALNAGDLRDTAQVALSYGVEHATERQAVVELAAIVRHALEHGIGSTNFDAIQAERDQWISDQRLIAQGDACTTESAQKCETELLAVAIRGEDMVPPRSDSDRQHGTSTIEWY
jgi:hypothetical protein